MSVEQVIPHVHNGVDSPKLSIRDINDFSVVNTVTNVSDYFLAGENIVDGDAVSYYESQSDGGIKKDFSLGGSVNGSIPFSVTVGNNPNRFLVLMTHNNSTGASITSIGHGTQYFFQIGNTVESGSRNNQIWGLFAPETGNKNITFFTTSGSVTYGLLSFYNVSQVNSFNQDMNHYTSSLTTNSNGSVVCGMSDQTIGSVFWKEIITNSWQAGWSGTVFPAGTAITCTPNGLYGLLVEIAPANAPVSSLVKASAAASDNNFINKYDMFVGIADETKSAGETIKVITRGKKTGLTGLDVPYSQYLSNTPGAISKTPGTNSTKIGVSISSTELLIK